MTLGTVGEVFLWVGLPSAVMLGTSAAYFVFDRSGMSLQRRLATSAHGLLAAVLYVSAVSISLYSMKPRPEVANALALLYLLPVALVIASFVWYRGPKSIHLIQLLNVPAMLVSAFVGVVGVAIVAF